nr:P-type conjugative transfer protein TrbG [Xanthomonas arboricola]
MKSLQIYTAALPLSGSTQRKQARPGRNEREAAESEYRQRLKDGLALVFPLFSPRFGLDRRTLYAISLLTLVAALSGCASQGKPPPRISLDEPVQAQPLPEPPMPVEVVEVPTVLPMPAQLKPLPEVDEDKPAPEPADETVRVSKANAEARIAPTREGYVNAIQVWPYTDGALYQVYAAPGRVTVISLQPGEELVTVAAGDTVRWIVGDTSSGSGDELRINVLVKPIRSGLKTNLVITTSRRTYLLELTSTERAWMASVSWDYPRDRMLALQRQAQAAQATAPVDTGLSLERIRFRYAISGSNPPWKPLRAFDDGEKVYIQFPPGIAQGELPPLFVIGAQGDGQLVNYRFRPPYYIVDRLFGAAELRLGGNGGDVVRIERTDGTRRN